jgi:hypothetical protein
MPRPRPVLFAAILVSSAAWSEGREFAILQGATGPRSTQVAILHQAGEPLHAVLREPGLEKARAPAASGDKRFKGSDWQVLQARFEGLKPGVNYSLEVVDAGGAVRDRRQLRTLDAKKTRLRFAVASCMDDAFARDQAGMWTDLLSRSPDLIFLIGDNVYADRPSVPGIGTLPQVLWKRYAETRGLLAVFRAPVLVPILAVWDDNDYGVNNGDGTYRFRNQSRKIFESFFAQAAIPGSFQRGPGVASRLAAFGQQFFLMDDRSFRGPATHWGKQQEDWLYRHLGKGAAAAWILNGDQFFGAYHRFESYERLHPESFRAFRARLRKLPAPVVLVSGDRHLTELMAIDQKDVGYATFELTTSAIHARTYPDPWKETPNPRQIAGAASVFNYAIVESAAVPGGLEFTVSAHGPGGKVLYQRDLRVQR